MQEVMVSIHQPNFMPWLKLLDKILASDVYVAYDTAQYTKSEYHSRQKIKTHYGDTWLTVPTLSTGSPRQIKDVEIDNSQPWRKKHLSALRTNYTKAEFFEEVYPLVQDVYGRDHTRLGDLGVDLIEEFRRYLGGSVRIVRSSSLGEVSDDNTEQLTQLVRMVGGNVHLTSTFGTERQYVDWERMSAAGVGIRSQVFEHPVYEQLWDGFVPNLAVLDMLCNCGQATAKILEANRRLDKISRPSLQTTT